jgi:hypothetical protein
MTDLKFFRKFSGTLDIVQLHYHGLQTTEYRRFLEQARRRPIEVSGLFETSPALALVRG